ncbi:MAG: 4-(cytidine 5'-diphospho)-2-C-methyl-D-erythritol kinase [Chloroflexi bacterium RBG_13_52_12]|nr:MAG: 4-(cytidine 5'-diphospho)-2-C-methyl-D-erythritol kinase [Chloroflexi bacterium RBG_13_52_12]
MVTVTAPAKINLTLEILRKRPDGFHEIRSVLQTIDLCDTLYVESGEGVSFQCDMEGWSADKSLVTKAVVLLRESTGCKKGAEIKIEKHIPLMSGLGGDSSNAAAVLCALNDLWGLNLPPEKLAELAAKLGSDVAFFLRGGTALAAGRGEKITPLPPIGRMWLVLVVPDTPVETGKTGRMYANLKPSCFTDGDITKMLVEALHKGKPFRPSMLFNTFENIAFEDFNIKQIYVEHLIKLGALHVHLAGSGPALFTMFQDQARTEDIYRRCKSQGMKAFMAATL